MKIHPTTCYGSSLGRAVAALTLAATLSACTGWQPTTASPRAVAGEDYVRVTSSDGTTVSFGNPEVVGDTLVGRGSDCKVCPPGGPCDLCNRPAVALADIEQLEVQRTSVRNTVLLGGLIAALIIGISAGGGLCCGTLNLH